MSNASLFALFGGVALLWYGIRQAGDGLQRLAGGRLTRILGVIGARRVGAAGAGILVTAILQSSTATLAMLVRFAGSGVMALPEALGVMLGAGVGTTLTVQLLAFPLAGVSHVLVGTGVLVQFAAKRRIVQHLGQALLGFGLIYLGMQVMGHGMAPLAQSGLLQDVLGALADQVLVGVVASAVLAALMGSSAAVLGLALGFAHQGLLPLPSAMSIVLGANLGTCAVPFAASLGAEAEGRRVAVAQFLVKLAGVVLALGLMRPFVALTATLSADPARQIANAHTLFNLGVALLFLPLIRPLARAVEVLIPNAPGGEQRFGPRYLDERFLSTPAVALAQATRESIRLADIVADMLRRGAAAFRGKDLELVEGIQRQDDQVDTLTGEIKRYATRLSQERLSPEESRRQVAVISFAGDMETIADIVDRNLMELAKQKIYTEVNFSKAGSKEIEELYDRVLQNLETAIAAFTAQDPALARRVLENKAEIHRLELEARQNHLRRLQEGYPESIQTSEIHLHVLANLKRINSHITATAYPILERD
jgi:phosphate:Na+ symporter